MSDKRITIIIITISIFLGIFFSYLDTKNAIRIHKKLKSLDVRFEDSLYFEINYIKWDGYLKCYVSNDSMSWCGRYDSYDNESDNNRFDRNVDNFKILSKKANCDTLITIDRYRQLRYYNIRSGPCYEGEKKGW
ncbi:MAG: hypothetical protein H6567_10765 [Lewinellaceae bacterium]|nr:hypothetical protein [Lewinellaceae bacterium]